MSRGRTRLLWVRALACAGLLAGHWLAYLVVRPDGHERGHLLEATGHGYWPVAASVAVALAAAGVVGHVAAGLRGRSPGFGRTLRNLAVPQAAGFVALELAERAVSGAHGGRLLPLLLAAGVAFQLVVAAALAALTTLLVRAVERLVSIARPRRRRLSASAFHRPRAVHVPSGRMLAGPRATRGPPTVSSS